MPDKKYLIEIPDMPEGTGIWDADKWERNKDAFMADNPTAKVFELGEYDAEDKKDTDQFLLTFDGDEESSGIWDADKWERNREAFLQDYPDATVNRVRYVDYWGQQAEANRAKKAELQQLDAERNARLAELGYYDDVTKGQADFSLNATNVNNLKPLSSAIEVNSVSGDTKFLDPNVQEFFAKDTADTERMAEIARLDAEYDANPSVVAYREWLAQMQKEQEMYRGNLRGEINTFLKEDVDSGKAGMGAAGKRVSPKYGMTPYVPTSEETAENEKREKAYTALKLLDKADIASANKGDKGFWAGAGDVAKEAILDTATQDDVEAYNEIGDILSKLEGELGDLKAETITPEVLEKHLSPEDKMLIMSFFEYNKAMAEAQKDMSRAYKGGKIFAESVPFMIEFLATGGFYAAGESATKGVANAAKRQIANAFVKWVTKNSAKKASRLAVARGVQKATTSVISALAGTAIRTAASPGTYERMAEASVEIDKEGHLHRAKNAAKAGIDMYIENLSETSGAAIGKVFGWLGKGAGKLATSLGGATFAKVGSFLGNNRTAQMLLGGWDKVAPKFAALGFHGIFEEVGEEILGNALREVTFVQPGALKEMFEDDNFGAMLLGFAPMTIFGAGVSAVSIGATNIQAAKLGEEMRNMMSSHYSADQIDYMLSGIQSAENADQMQEAINPMLDAISMAVATGQITQEEAKDEVDTIYRYGMFMAQNKALLFAQREQDRDIAEAKRTQMTDRYGRFWQDGDNVQIAELNDGRTVFVTSAAEEDGAVTIIDAVTGQKGFANISDIATEEVDGEMESKTNTMTMDAFLYDQIAMERKNAEQVRMTNERNAQIDALRAEIVPGTQLNLGTEGSPIIVYAKGSNRNGVSVIDQFGVEHVLGWEQAADALKKPIVVLTDKQILDAKIAERAAEMASRRRKYGSMSPTSETASEEAVNQAETTAAEEQRHIPMNEDGTVNERAFWEQDPEGYVAWNDEQNQDGGADSLEQISITKAETEQLLSAAIAATRTSDPVARKQASKEAARLMEKIALLETLEQRYDAKFQEEVAALEQTNATPTASMNEEQLEQMDAQYQNILSQTRMQRERVRVMQEYLDKLAEGSVQAVLLTRANYVERMKEEGCNDALIDIVQEQVEAGKPVAGFMAAGKVLLMDEGLFSIDEVRVTYVHERQHVLNRNNPQLVQRVADALGSRDQALEILKTFVGEKALRTYEKDSLHALADEIICRSMEVAYSNENFSVDLQSRGISEDVISIITEIDNEQRQDQSLSHARRRGERNSHADVPGAGSVREDGRNSGQVSRGVLDQEETRSSQISERGDEAGEGGEGAEVNTSDDEEQIEEPADEDILTEEGFEVDEQNEDVRFSIRYLPTPEQREGLINSIVKITGQPRDIAERWLDSELSLASIVLNDREYLDYAPDSKYKAIKDNSDYPQGTVDFNNICRKRKDFTRMYTRLQRAYPNRIFTAENLADIRTIMSEDGLVVACGLCYVEDRRQKLGEVADEFIKDLQDGFKNYGKKNATKRANAEKFRSFVGEDTYVPSIYDLITLEGSDKLHDEHKGIWDAFGAYNRARGQQTQNTFQGYAEYKREILTWSDAKVKKVNSLGGLRIFSYSDFEAHHLLDIIQIIIDCAARGVMIQGYTKVPEFARVVEKTGIKLNRSLIPLGDTGIVDGKLAYDPVEGIDINDPNFLESNDNVGNILIGINDEQIRMAMADPFIHYIIPYHARQAGNIRAKLNVGAWTNYIDTQNERKMSDGKRVEKNINIYTDVLNESITNDREFVEKYLEVCREKGYIPKFDQFLNKDAEGNYVYTPGYYKFLVDFKLFDEAGNILPQKPVMAQFDDAFNAQVLNDYVREERETAGASMNSTYDKIVETLDLGEPIEGEDVRFSIKKGEESTEDTKKVQTRNIDSRSETNNIIDRASALVAGTSIAEQTKQRRRREKERLELTKDLYSRILNNQFDDVTLRLIDKYIEDATPENPYGSRISQRLPQEMERGLFSGERASAVNALFSRVSEGAVSPSDRKSQSGKKKIEETKKNLLKNWAKATGMWYDSLSDVKEIADTTPFDEGTESKVYASTIDGYIIKTKKGKPYGKRFRPDIDDLSLFNYIFPDTAYHIIGYGDFGDGISTIVAQPAVVMSDENVTTKERVGHMASIGMKPINKEKTAFSNGKIVASDIQGKNIVKDASGNIRVIDADMKLHTTDVGGEHVIPDVETDTKDKSVSFRVRSEEERDKLFEDAKKEFGTTKNFNEAGYMLPDASLLDFSEKDFPGERSIDHRAIEGVIIENGNRYENRWEYLADFMNEGAIRLLPESAGINMIQAPTEEQRKKIFDFIYKYNGEVILEINDERLNSVVYMEYDRRTSPSRIFRDIDGYFNEGIVPEQDVRFRVAFDSANSELNSEGISINNPALMEEYGLSDITLSKNGNYVTLSKVVVADKGNGNGTRFMSDLTKIADENGWTLVLTPDKSFGASSVARLKKFYKRFGFKDNKGRNTDFNTKESMVRTPSADVRFRMSNDNQAIFVSNAAKAVEGIKMEKATPEQWLKMIEKNGGLKAGEDKWMGLSDWLKASDKKTLTKAEVLDFINENMIVIEEQHYANEGVRAEADRILNENYPGWEEAFSFDWDPFMEEPHSDIYDEVKAARLYNESHEDQVEIDENGDIVNNDDYTKVEEFGVELAGIWYGRGKENTVREIHGTREDYTTNGLTNLHEIALTVPTIESWNESDELHFGDAGEGRAVAWIRFGETSMSIVSQEAKDATEALEEFEAEIEGKYILPIGDALGMMTEEESDKHLALLEAEHVAWTDTSRKVLVIDEIQSKRHQEGREKGYKSSASKRLLEDANALSKQLAEFEDELRAKYKIKGAYSTYELMPAVERKGSKEDYERYIALNNERNAKYAEYEKSIEGVDRNAPFEAPFDKNWHELAMKRMLRYAAENGYDIIAWTKGDQQNQRYGLSKVVDEIYVASDFASTKSEESSFRMILKNGNDNHVGVNKKTGIVTFYNENPQAIGKPLSDLLGKELADKILAARDYQTFSGVDFELSEGMKGFYDKMLPAFMNKYGKKWGVKVEDIELNGLENGLTMHSVPVTEEMKASVMEGQVMFRINREDYDSAVSFTEAVVQKFSEKYFNTTPIRILDGTKPEEALRALGLESMFTPKDIENVLAGYIEGKNIIAIFAKDRVREVEIDEDVIENAIFHECIHQMTTGKKTYDRLSKYLWDNADALGLSEQKADIQKDYDQSQWYYEMIASALADKMTAGKSEELLRSLPAVERAMTKVIFNKFGYEPGKEDIQRANAGQELSRDNLRNEESRPESQRGSSSETRFRATEITPEVRAEMDTIAATAIVNGNYLKAPNGADTNLTPEQWAMVRTKNFIDWFGDWINDPENASKVVDENGEPRIMHHGSDWQPLSESVGDAVFNMNDGILGKGAYFASSLMEATMYAEIATGLDTSIDGNLEILQDEYVSDYFLNIRDKKDIFEFGDNDIIAVAKSPSQIKSATDNTGEFSNEDGDIRFRTSLELDEEFGDAWRNQQNEDGRHSTQVANTKSTYEKIGRYLEDAGMKGASILDASSGLGLGTQALREMGFQVDDVEPFPSENREAPTFSSYADIDGKYDVVISNAVLNVIPDDWRADVLHQMADAVKDGGKMIINTRPASNIAQQGVEGKTRITLDSPSEILVKRGDRIAAYQKGFTSEELAEWIKSELGEGWRVEKATKKNSGISGEGTAVVIKEYDDTRFRTIGTPTEDVVAQGISLSPSQTASLAGDIFAALPVESRKKITDGLNGNILGLQDAIMQIPTSLAMKEDWNEEDTALANIIREQMQDLVDSRNGETARPLTTKEALWMLYRMTSKQESLVDAARTAIVGRNLGFDPDSIRRRGEVNDYIRFRAASGGAIDAATDMYNYETSLWTERLKESWLDMNQSVISLQNAMAAASGMPIEPWENIEWALNRLSSKSYADKKKYLRDFLIPLWDAVMQMVKVNHISIEEIERYMMLKHGLERNVKLAKRDARAHYQEIYDDIIAKIKGMNPAQKRTYLTNAQLRDADAKAELARLQAINTSAFTPDQLKQHNKDIAKAKKEADDAAEHLVRAQKVATMTEQDAQDELNDIFDNINNEIDSVYKEMRKNDYCGMSAMFVDKTEVKRSNYKSEEAYQKAVLENTKPRFQKVEDMEAEAELEVNNFERANTGYLSLWAKVNAATKETLRHQYDSGMITAEQYDAVRDMFEYYVPLRGFADNTAEDMYSYYMNNSSGGFAKPIIAAKGRKTRAESPLGWIGTMAESAIQADNKNEAKMCLYYAALRRPDLGVLSITETWYEYTGKKDANGKKIFAPAYPPKTDRALSADELRQHMEDWENDMKKKQARGEAYKGSQSVDLKGSVVFQNANEEKEHVVRVKVAGKDYSILVNGNPRAAQAINGLLNPDVNQGPVEQWISDARRNLSALLTSYSPLFWVANFQRDLLSSTMRVSEADGWGAAGRYLANRRKAWRVVSYINKYEDGNLGNSYYEQLYREFAENGGITGYTSLTTNKEYEELLSKYANTVDKPVLNAVKNVWDKFMGFGEAIEQVTRFAAYITARESGKSIEEAVNAAKEVSVNFNRKGSAKPISKDELDKLRTKSGKQLNKVQRVAALILSAMPGPMKWCYYFINASLQALSSSAKLAKKSKGKAAAWTGLYMGTSIALAMLSYLLSGDDDDEYLDLPDYLRHSTILIKVSDGYYFKWSIPQEMRPFYAWADILVRKMMGNTPHKSALAVGKEMALSAAQWLPVNPFDAEDPLLSLVPDVAAPFAEIKANANAFGSKIYDDMPNRSEAVAKEIPAYRKATPKTGELYVDLSEFLNDVTGGDESQTGWININPAIMEHVVEGYGGGIYDFAKMMVALPGILLSEDPVQMKEIPFVNKIILSVDETNMYSHTNEAFFLYKNIADNAKRVENEYRNSDNPERADAYKKEEDWRIYLLYKQYESDLMEVKERIDNAVDKTEEKLLKEEQNALREMFLDDVAKGNVPEVTVEISEDMKMFDKIIKDVMRPANEANKERLKARDDRDLDRMREAAKKRDSLKALPEYKAAEAAKKTLKKMREQLEGIEGAERGSQKDSVLSALQKNHDILKRQMSELQ